MLGLALHLQMLTTSMVTDIQVRRTAYIAELVNHNMEFS